MTPHTPVLIFAQTAASGTKSATPADVTLRISMFGVGIEAAALAAPNVALWVGCGGYSYSCDLRASYLRVSYNYAPYSYPASAIKSVPTSRFHFGQAEDARSKVFPPASLVPGRSAGRRRQAALP